VRTRYREHLRKRLAEGSAVVPDRDLLADAIVFAPHPDDETLGCGGTIARRTELGARTSVIVMTDGCMSHHQFMPADELAALREEECRQACSCLGVEPGDLHFLGFGDAHLEASRDHAGLEVRAILDDTRPEIVYVPSAMDPPQDHALTNTIVHAALREFGGAVRVYEYPVWLWDQWPWTRGRRRLHRLFDPIRSFSRNRQLLHILDSRVDIGSQLSRKQRALSAYGSQMTRLRAVWPILADVSDGEFLDCLLQPFEYFCASADYPLGSPPTSLSAVVH
jgi:LmbE family N-acetylglucosaminyl deacetylase